jgi:hypothetical protein
VITVRISLQRQTFIVIGVLLGAGLALGVWVNGWFLLLPAFLAFAMIGAGIRGVCMMTRMLSKLPGNPPSTGDIR